MYKACFEIFSRHYRAGEYIIIDTKLKYGILLFEDAIHVETNNFDFSETDYYDRSDEINERYGVYQFATLQNKETRRYEMISDRSLQFNSDILNKLRIEAVGDKGMYSVLIFSNNKPIHLAKDKYNYLFKLSGNDMFSKEMEISVEDAEGTLYALVFPLESDVYMPFLSNKAKFETN